MKKDRILATEALRLYSREISKWRAEGFGRIHCTKKLIKLSGRQCSTGSMQTIFKNLDSLATKPLDIQLVDDTIEDEIPIEELIENRILASKRKNAKTKQHKKTLMLPAEPFGIMVFGDPHVDNDGCDWSQLCEHVKLAQSTEGILASCVGDMQDNWIGRLGRLYSESSVTASDGWRLSEWFLKSMQWIAIVGGNHDAWANGPGVDPMQLLSKKTGVMCYAPDEIRIILQWKDEPDLDPIVWIIRHDFKGRSWYHPTHGPHKEAMLDGKCHLLTAGHIHQWGQLTTEQRHGRVTHAVRVRGYKRSDSFAMAKGFFEQDFGETALVVIDPKMEGPGRIKIFWDLKDGCDYLTFLRRHLKNKDASTIKSS
jgi:hypothetical protein